MFKKNDFYFNTNDECHINPYNELITNIPNYFNEGNIPYRKSIFLNKTKLNNWLVKFEIKNVNKGGIDSWDYYDEDFFKENLLIRVAYYETLKYVKIVFNKKQISE